MSTLNPSIAAQTSAHIRPALASDAAALRQLLSAAKLPLDGLPDTLEHFLVAEGAGAATGAGADASSAADASADAAARRGAVVGAVGLEMYGPVALLRSAVVHPDLRGQGVGEALVQAALQYAEERGVQDIVLLTTTADRWFPRFGFSRISREEVPEAVHASAELRGACPASAVVMRRQSGAGAPRP